MRGLIRRAAVVASSAVVFLGPVAGEASASGGPVLNWSPTTYNYGTVSVGHSLFAVFTLSNSGSKAASGKTTSALTIRLAGGPVFTVVSSDCPGRTLAPGQSCSVMVRFVPIQAGQTYGGELTAISSKPFATASLPLEGTGAKASPAITTSPSAGGPIGSTRMTDTATLSGGYKATGSIEFKLYGPSATADCSGAPVDDEKVTVSGDGTYATPAGFTPTQAGTYWWTASDSGDPNNNPTASGCGAESVTISKASPAIATAPSAGGTVGTAVTDTATLAGSYKATGSIEFKLYGPSATADCSGAPVDDEKVTVSGDGTYATPAGFTPTQAGTYWWTASYSGDPNNNPAASGCDQEQVTISKVSPAVATSPSANGAGTAGSTTVTDTAALSGGSVPGGSIEFQLYGPSATADCSGTPVDDEIVTVSGNGNYTTPAGATPSQAGTYWWAASYSGDANNNPAATNCGDESVTISKATPAISTNPSQGGPVGTTVTDTAALSGGSVPGGSIEFQLYGPSATADCSGTPVDDEIVTVSGNGNYTTPAGATPSQTGTYWWTASYSGDANNNPAATNCGDEPVTIGASSANLYWTYPDTGTVNEANLDGSNPHAIVTGQPFPGGIAVGNGHLYWSDPNGIMEAGLDGSNPRLIVTGQTSPGGVAVNSSNLYWRGPSGIMEAGLDGSNPHVIVPAAGAGGITVDSSHLYWTGGSGLFEAGLDGSNPHSIAGPQNGTTGVTVNSSKLYWADAGGPPGTGTINEAGLDGSNAQVFVGGLTGPGSVAVDSSHLYWIDANGTITEVGLDGSSPKTVITGQTGPAGPGWVAVGPQ